MSQIEAPSLRMAWWSIKTADMHDAKGGKLWLEH